MLEALRDRLKKSGTMNYRQDRDVLSTDFVDNAVAIQEALAHRCAAQFGHRASGHRLFTDRVAQRKQRVDDPSRMLQRVAGNELRDGVDVIERLVGSD